MTFNHRQPALALLLVAIPVVCFLSWGGAEGPSRPSLDPNAQVSPRLGYAAEARGELERPGSPPAPAARAPAAPCHGNSIGRAPGRNPGDSGSIPGRGIDWPAIMDRIWFMESRRGLDKRCWTVGPAGEYGEYQITPPFLADVVRIAGFHIDRADNDSCRAGIELWLRHYAPRVGAETTDELYELYRRGPAGYRRWEASR